MLGRRAVGGVKRARSSVVGDSAAERRIDAISTSPHEAKKVPFAVSEEGMIAGDCNEHRSTPLIANRHDGARPLLALTISQLS